MVIDDVTVQDLIHNPIVFNDISPFLSERGFHEGSA